MNKWLFIAAMIVLHSLAAAAPRSEHYQLNKYVINSAGTTCTAAGRQAMDTVGEAATGPQRGKSFALQAGFFNEYFLSLAIPTPTITPTVIRTFNGEVIHEQYIFAAPNPMRGNVGHIFFDLAEPAQVTVKIFTTNSRLVISKDWDNLPAGTNRWDWEMGNMANGVYLLRITARGGDGRETKVTKKIVIIH